MDDIFEVFPIDGIDLDSRIQDILDQPGFGHRAPDEAAGIRFSKFISLDPTLENRYARIIELFVESRVEGPPKSTADGFQHDEVKFVEGAMLFKSLLHEEGRITRIGSYMPKDTFIKKMVTSPAIKIKLERWYDTHREMADFDDESLQRVSSNWDSFPISIRNGDGKVKLV